LELRHAEISLDLRAALPAGSERPQTGPRFFPQADSFLGAKKRVGRRATLPNETRFWPGRQYTEADGLPQVLALFCAE
jgi:hypothetical protein